MPQPFTIRSILGMTGTVQLELPFGWLSDRLRPQAMLFGRSISAYQVWGVGGLLCAAALAVSLALHRRLELPVLAVLLAGAIATFFAVVIVMKVVTGRETLVYYQHEIAILAQAAVLLWLLGHPALPYLDITALAVGCFLAFGRIGCLMVGCCHGRPADAGVRYGPAHADAGFARPLVGVPLVPVQAMEAGWVLLIVVAEAARLARGSPPGDALASYIAAYGIGRFCLEYWRGDSLRPYWKGSSAAQWISVASVGLVARAEFVGRLPWHTWHAAAAVLLAALTLWNAIRDRGASPLLRASHVSEIAEGLAWLPTRGAEAPGIPVATTSLGIRISRGELRAEGGQAHHYTFSWRDGVLAPEEARKLAVLACRLRGHSHPYLLTRGGSGAWHVVFGSVAVAVLPEQRIAVK